MVKTRVLLFEFGTPAIFILGKDEVKKRAPIRQRVIMYLNLELELALVAIIKCLVPLHENLGPNFGYTHTHTS